MSQVTDLYYRVVPVTACPRCLDTGVWLSPRNEVLVCPKIQLGEKHADANESSLILRKSANRMFREKKFIHAFEFELARVLTHYSNTFPCQRDHLFDFLFADTNLDFRGKLRKFHSLVEALRKDWLLPIGSRKTDPSGYWIITELRDYKDWVNRARSAPITQLSTIHRNAKFNFPEFAEQLELEFWNDTSPEVSVNV